MDRDQDTECVVRKWVEECRVVEPPAGWLPRARPEVTNILGYERVIATSDLRPLSYLRGAVSAADSVVRIADSRGQPLGTGVLISEHLLLTSNHVLPNERACRRAQVQLATPAVGNGERTRQLGLDPQVFFLKSPAAELDYTLVGLQRSVDPPRSWAVLSRKRVQPRDRVSIIQFPDGGEQQIALEDNWVFIADDVERPNHYVYFTDTRPGSSGAPVYNASWEVVALHHRAVANVDDRGNLLARDGSRWASTMGDDEIDWLANQGVRIDKILDHVAAQRLFTLEQRNLRSELLGRVSGGVEINPQGSPSPVGTLRTSTIEIPIVLHLSIDGLRPEVS